MSLVSNAAELPVSLDAEAAVLGACLFSANAAEWVAAHLDGADFAVRAHQTLFAAISALVAAGTPPDLLTLPEYLTARGQLAGVGGLPRISALADSVPTAAHVEHYGATLRAFRTRRELIRHGQQCIAAGRDDPDPEAALAAANQRLEEILTRAAFLDGGDAASLGSLIPGALGDLLPRETGQRVTTGYPSLDTLLGGGVGPTDYGILMGRASMGKTTVGLNMALSAARQGRGVLIVSLEMSRTIIAQSLLCAAANVDRAAAKVRLARGEAQEDWLRLQGAGDVCGGYPLWVADRPGLTVSQIRALARPLVRQGLALVVVDQLQAMRAESRAESEQVRVSRLVYELQAAVRSLGCACLLQAQVNREVEKRADRRPTLADARDSGAVEQAADWVLALYRPDYYRRSQAGEQDDGTGPVEFGLLKNRIGGTGWRTMQGDLARCRVWDPTAPGDADAPPAFGARPTDLPPQVRRPWYDGPEDPE